MLALGSMRCVGMDMEQYDGYVDRAFVTNTSANKTTLRRTIHGACARSKASRAKEEVEAALGIMRTIGTIRYGRKTASRSCHESVRGLAHIKDMYCGNSFRPFVIKYGGVEPATLEHCHTDFSLRYHR